MTRTPPTDTPALLLRHLRPNYPDHWATARPPTPTANAAPFVPETVTTEAGRYSHTAQVRCDVCGHTVGYRRLSAEALAERQARLDRVYRVGRRIRLAGVLPLFACGPAAAAVTGYVWLAPVGAAAGLLLLRSAWRGPRAAPPIAPHSVDLRRAQDPHDVVAWPLDTSPTSAGSNTQGRTDPSQGGADSPRGQADPLRDRDQEPTGAQSRSTL